MSFFPSMNPASFVSTIALTAATGGAGLLVSQIVTQIASKIGQQMLQQFGQQLGLPQSVIDAAQGAMCSAMGDVGGAMQNYQEASSGFVEDYFQGASPQQSGDIQRGVDEIEKSMQDWFAQSVANSGRDEEGNARGGSAGRSSGGGSWLMALAKALGNQLNAAQAKLERTMDGTNWEKSDQVAEFQAMSQEFALFMNTATNVLKTVGESLSTMARKQ